MLGYYCSNEECDLVSSFKIKCDHKQHIVEFEYGYTSEAQLCFDFCEEYIKGKQNDR